MLTDKKIYVTGGTGFFGKHVIHELEKQNCKAIFGYQHFEGRSLTHFDNCYTVINYYRPDIIIHLAGYNGGIKFNIDYPADIFYQNTSMALNIHEAARQCGVQKILSVVTSCAWSQPENHWETLRDDEILTGCPDKTVECHGYAKRNLYLASKYYREQYNMDTQTLCVTTLFGPGDSFDPKRTKVVGALIKKFVDAVDEGKNEVECWGTGFPQRQLIYVKDAARELVKLANKKTDREYPICLGSDWNFTIKYIAEYIANLVNFKGTIKWNTNMPDGQQSKKLKTDKIFGVVKTTPIQKAFEETIEYYRKIKNEYGNTNK